MTAAIAQRSPLGIGHFIRGLRCQKGVMLIKVSAIALKLRNS